MLHAVSRAHRVAQELKKILSFIIQYSLRDPRLNKMITISEVLLSTDCSYAKVFITLLENEDKLVIIETIKVLNNATGFIRTLLRKKINLRIIPKLFFIYDNSFINGIKISNIISNEIKKEKIHNNTIDYKKGR
ncbi:30S ribosome-binding factor RbfA [Buchnera aphidicola]|uniref:30S ribosome-binding factor RbfA n=1 Tax=Buchnera aphidicola TaxID=9 RepID=UPI003464B90C